MKETIKKLVGKKTLTGILAQFKSLLTDLDAVMEEGKERLDENYQQRAQLVEEAADLRVEVNRAKKVSNNIKQLIEE